MAGDAHLDPSQLRGMYAFVHLSTSPLTNAYNYTYVRIPRVTTAPSEFEAYRSAQPREGTPPFAVIAYLRHGTLQAKRIQLYRLFNAMPSTPTETHCPPVLTRDTETDSEHRWHRNSIE